MKKIVLISAFALMLNYSNAQKIKFSDVYLYGYSGNSTANPLNKSEISFLNKGIDLPYLSNIKNNGNTNRYYNGVGVMAGWNIANNKKSNLQHKLRTGVSFGNYGLNYDGNWSKSTSTTIDSVVLQSTGQSFPVDSIFSQYANVSHNAKMFNVDASYIVTLNPHRRLSFYTGVGASVGISLQNVISGHYNEFSYSNSPFANYSTYQNNNSNNHQFSSKTLPVATNIRAYIPLGLNFRLSNKNPFLKHFSLYGEIDMGLNIDNMKGINSNIGFYSAGNAGIKVSFGEMLGNKRGDRQMPTKTRRKNY
ncbi:MAG: hypothetical protein KA275_07450 [Chitinophagaceae bacterium]|nr:hypothetical protein [Chitinophagaceae bacterium]